MAQLYQSSMSYFIQEAFSIASVFLSTYFRIRRGKVIGVTSHTTPISKMTVPFLVVETFLRKAFSNLI